MKFTLSSLKNYLETSAYPEKICETLTSIGLELESLTSKAKTLEPFTVAKIIEAKPHQNSDKLKICLVETKDSQQFLQIICGAANARSGLKVAYAPIGSTIPANGMVIKKAKIAGTESNGMLCSKRELCIGEEDLGIIEIDEKWPIGTKISEVFSFNDALIEINVTPNRGDCLGVYGIARDLAASGIGTLKNLETKKTPSKFPFPLTIKNDAPEICTHAAFRYFKNVKNCESPKWLKEKLSVIGINSISAIVDITNYVMHEFNRPLHAYDAKKINSSLAIRLAKKDENFTSLKNAEFVLDEKILVIADETKILATAGIIGANNSSCQIESTEILLESAFFSPSNVAYCGRKLNIQSDARHRFERGIDNASCEFGIDVASQMILEICGGEASEILLIGEKFPKKKIIFDYKKIKKLIGLEVPIKRALEILNNLGFVVVEKISEEEFLIEIPSYRHDISVAQDLVEEVVRIFGYSAISKQALPKLQSESEKLQDRNLLHKIRSFLASRGMTESINWSFVDSNLIEIFGEKLTELTLLNPISSEMDHMRTTLAIGLIQSYKKNSLRNFSDLSLFEIGNVFLSKTQQTLMISGLRAGKNKEQNLYHDSRDFDVFDVKKDFFDVVEIFGIRPESLQINISSPLKYYHPYRFAEVRLGKNLIGYFGEIHSSITKKFDLKTRINFFEIFVDNLPSSQKSVLRKAFVVNDLQIVERDFAFIVDQDLEVAHLIKTVANVDKQQINDVKIFDIFSGKNMAEGKKSVALRVKIQPQEKTLTSEEIEEIAKKIIFAAENNHQATVRKADVPNLPQT